MTQYSRESERVSGRDYKLFETITSFMVKNLQKEQQELDMEVVVFMIKK